MALRWSAWDDCFLKRHYEEFSAEEMAEKLKRTVGAVRSRASLLAREPSATFECVQCGRRVVTKSIRKRFCGSACQGDYWRHLPPKQKTQPEMR